MTITHSIPSNSRRAKIIYVFVALIIASFVLSFPVRQALRLKAFESNRPQWRAEIKAAREQVQQGRNVLLASNAATINLKPFVTAALTDTVFWPKGMTNDLSPLPTGFQTFAGVPFQVDGMVQLMGNGIELLKKSYPTQVIDIPITRPCRRIHLLHGASSVLDHQHGSTVANLVLHYDNGTSAELKINFGEHLLDWWGPLFKTGLKPETCVVTGSGTELGWVGTNSAIVKYQPEWSIRIYKSTFENPQSGVRVASVDYVSTMTHTAPFLLGLTIE